MKITHRNCKAAMWVLFALGVVFCLLGMASRLWAVPGFLLFAAAVEVNFIYWRCPHCKKRLPGKLGRSESCPNCGAPLF